MKNELQKVMLALFSFLAFPLINNAQKPILGTAENFILFTTTGLVGNTGISNITGDIGTNSGATTGFGAPTTVNGDFYSGNTVTAQAALDVQAAYDDIFAMTATNNSHAPAFGGGEILPPGIYLVGGAGSIAANLILDAAGDPNALFIFNFGGSFTTAASAEVTLINGAQACNIFWIAEGAIAMAAETKMSGTMIANNGAISMGYNGVLNGRMLSTTGEATFYEVLAALPVCDIPLPVTLISFTGVCKDGSILLNWSTASESNNHFFTPEYSIDGIIWQSAGTVYGAGTASRQTNYSFTDNPAANHTRLYRLKQTDFDGNFKISKHISVKVCKGTIDHFMIYPNPSNGEFRLVYTGDTGSITSIEIFNTTGRKIYTSSGYPVSLDIKTQAPGVYIMRVHTIAEIISLKLLVK